MPERGLGVNARDIAVIAGTIIGIALLLTALVVVPGELLYAVFGMWGIVGWTCFLAMLCIGGGNY